MGEEDPKETEADVEAMLDLTKKKKKKKKKKDKSSSSENKEASSSADGGLSAADLEAHKAMLKEHDQAQIVVEDPYDKKADYTYEDLLDRIVEILQANNPDLTDKKRRNVKPPQLTNTSRKTIWVNFQETCTMLQRSPDHVLQFFMAELGTEGNLDGNQRLVIKGRYVPKYIESLLRKYIVEYVTCEMCRGANTDLTKDSSTRLYFCSCRDCGSTRSVAQIRSGYHATSRADRRAARNANG